MFWGIRVISEEERADVSWEGCSEGVVYGSSAFHCAVYGPALEGHVSGKLQRRGYGRYHRRC